MNLLSYPDLRQRSFVFEIGFQPHVTLKYHISREYFIRTESIGGLALHAHRRDPRRNMHTEVVLPWRMGMKFNSLFQRTKEETTAKGMRRRVNNNDKKDKPLLWIFVKWQYMSDRSVKTSFYKRPLSGVAKAGRIRETKLHRPIILVAFEGLCHVILYIQHKGISHSKIKVLALSRAEWENLTTFRKW